MKNLVFVLWLCVFPYAAYAIEEQVYQVNKENADDKWVEIPEGGIVKDSIVEYIPQFVKTPKSGLSWDILATTKEVFYTDKDAEGYDIEGTRPEFTQAVQKLDKTKILMQGYMFPLDQNEKQARFLFGPFPISCPYHYHIGPSMVIEVTAQNPISFTYDPVNLSGRLELVPRDDDFNVFYRLKDAIIVP